MKNTVAAASLFASFIAGVQPSSANLPPPDEPVSNSPTPAQHACLKPSNIFTYAGKQYESDGKYVWVSPLFPVFTLISGDYFTSINTYSCDLVLDNK